MRNRLDNATRYLIMSVNLKTSFVLMKPGATSLSKYFFQREIQGSVSFCQSLIMKGSLHKYNVYPVMHLVRCVASVFLNWNIFTMRNESAHQAYMYTHRCVLLCRWIWIYEYLYIYAKVGQKIPCFCHHIHFKMYRPHNLHSEKIRPHTIIWMITLWLRRRFDFDLKGTNSIHQSLFSTRGKWMVSSHRQLGDFISCPV